MGDKGAQLAWKLKLSGLSELLAETASPVEQALMEQMVEALSDLEGDVRLVSGEKCCLLVPPCGAHWRQPGCVVLPGLLAPIRPSSWALWT